MNVSKMKLMLVEIKKKIDNTCLVCKGICKGWTKNSL